MEPVSAHTEKINQLLLSRENMDRDKINDMIYNLFVKCKREMENECLYKPLKDYLERVEYYTGIPKNKINKIACIREIDENNKYFKFNQRLDILKCVADMYVVKKIPTHRNIYALCRSVNTDMDYYQFQYKMNILGYEWRKNELGQEILIEDPELTFERYRYLKQIFKFRLNCTPVYFVDEIFVDKTFTFQKPWVNNIDVSSEACDGYVFFHAISIKGCLNGFFCSPTSKQDFVKWITHVLIPNLQKPSVIVLDKNDLHRSRVNFITKYHSKAEMLKYLRQKNIPCNEKLDKADVYSLITACTVKDSSYDVEEILKSHGHTVLWLPSKYHDLSMTHFLWTYIRESKKIDIHYKELREIKIKLFEGLMKLDPYVWKRLDEDLLKLEKQFFDVGVKISEALENNYTFSDNSCDK